MFYDEKGVFSGTALVHFRDGDVRPARWASSVCSGPNPCCALCQSPQSAAKAWEQLNEKLVDGSAFAPLSLARRRPVAWKRDQLLTHAHPRPAVLALDRRDQTLPPPRLLEPVSAPALDRARLSSGARLVARKPRAFPIVVRQSPQATGGQEADAARKPARTGTDSARVAARQGNWRRRCCRCEEEGGRQPEEGGARREPEEAKWGGQGGRADGRRLSVGPCMYTFFKHQSKGVIAACPSQGATGSCLVWSLLRRASY
jgi:hypothetical protein